MQVLQEVQSVTTVCHPWPGLVRGVRGGGASGNASGSLLACLRRVLADGDPSRAVEAGGKTLTTLAQRDGAGCADVRHPKTYVDMYE